ncbi:MAG: DNA/RNA nuclease SfsA [SAR202 cluster bacterium]|nr:DNA/RNA nuclease SfsA [SAR202 cluster bacterium]
MQLDQRLVEGRFLRRLNRFAAEAEIDGKTELVHVANSGRMRELLVAGNRILLRPVAADAARKTRYDLALVDLGWALASADARLPNALVAEAIEQRRLSPFVQFTQITREVTFGESRLDLMLTGPQGRCYIETKSVTLVEQGVGLFPDAPTIRGVRHLGSLEQVLTAGHRAAVIFVVQREDAKAFAPHDQADPALGYALRHAVAAGVEAYAYRCRVSAQEITLADPLEVRL